MKPETQNAKWLIPTTLLCLIVIAILAVQAILPKNTAKEAENAPSSGSTPGFSTNDPFGIADLTADGAGAGGVLRALPEHLLPQ